jgi:ribosome-associated heat shock protein Hsp15
MQGVRIDKWLWSIRMYKTRTISTDQCKSGNVKNQNGISLKPSTEVHSGDIITIRKSGINFKVQVVELIPKRVSSELAKKSYIDLTEEAELKKFDLVFMANRGTEYRDRGLGRPTKKERREIDDFKSFDWEDLDEYHKIEVS